MIGDVWRWGYDGTETMIKRTSLANWQGAWFSDDMLYRFLLWRRWNPDTLTTAWCNFIMLNPSTADEFTNDQTVERCQKRAIRWGYGGLYVTNLFGLRATDPRELTQRAKPIGQPDNDTLIIETAKVSKLVVCAWGNDGCYQGRGREVAACLSDAGIALTALRVSRTGEPSHPLYLPYSLTAISFSYKEKPKCST